MMGSSGTYGTFEKSPEGSKGVKQWLPGVIERGSGVGVSSSVAGSPRSWAQWAQRRMVVEEVRGLLCWFSHVDTLWPPWEYTSWGCRLYPTSQCHTLAGTKLRKTPSWIEFWLRGGGFLYYEIYMRWTIRALFWFGAGNGLKCTLSLYSVIVAWLSFMCHWGRSCKT